MAFPDANGGAGKREKSQRGKSKGKASEEGESPIRAHAMSLQGAKSQGYEKSEEGPDGDLGRAVALDFLDGMEG